MKIFKSHNALDHLPSKELKAMSFELWSHMKNGGDLQFEGLKEAHNSLLKLSRPIPLDFIKCVVAFNETTDGVHSNAFFIAPNLSFDYYKIQVPSQISFSHSTAFTNGIESGFL